MKTSTLDKHITKYCKKFGIKKVISSNEFAYTPNNETITYTMYIYDNDLNFVKLVNRKYSCNIQPLYFIFCLLHEIGHHMTFENLTAEDIQNDLICRQVIIPNIEDEERQGQAYINLFAERLATEWALNYIQTHFEECVKIQKRFLRIMAHYTKKERGK